MTTQTVSSPATAEAEPGIEITQEMIEAGRDEIARCWIDFTSNCEGPALWGEVLTRVFRAMFLSRPQRGP